MLTAGQLFNWRRFLPVLLNVAVASALHLLVLHISTAQGMTSLAQHTAELPRSEVRVHSGRQLRAPRSFEGLLNYEARRLHGAF